MCGVVGVVGTSSVSVSLYDALTMLQHRGQDAAGIATCHRGRVYQNKGNGMVRDVFKDEHMQSLLGNMGIGHVRYPTAGGSSDSLAQPFYVNSPYGISLAHNGNLTNTQELMDELFRTGLRHINTESDSEVLLNVLALELQNRGQLIPAAEDIFAAVAAVNQRCRGGYAVTAMIADYGIVAFRDPLGIRPLVFGSRE
ncbi:MAG TPA: class II glutamine amidotransferase, partial [Pseudomonadales bacterium]|nr:class II glutamine amidotransferase [Pseudomonadales bacterium]